MPEPVLWTEIERPAPDLVVVRCYGRLVWGAEDLLYTTVKALIPTTPRIVLDLAELVRMDSMGLGTLVRLYVSAKSAGCRLELMHLNKQIRNLLGLTGLFDVFAVVGEKGVRFM
jgi:anti-sigma B factor antagonist